MGGDFWRRCRVALASQFLAVGLLVSACGGGGAGGGAAPPGAPPPAPLTNVTLTSLVAPETFAAASATLGFDIDGTGTTSNPEALFAGLTAGDSVRYDPADDSFTLSVSQGNVSYNQKFAAADINQASSDPSLRVYTVNNGGGDITDLVLVVPGDPTYGLTYTTFGIWNSETADPSHDLSFGVVVFGVRTPVGNMPNTGQASYSGPMFGQLDSVGTSFTLTGDVQIDVDFSNGNVNGLISNIVRENPITGGLSTWESIRTTGSITAGSNTFTGTAESFSRRHTGSASGGFFGPASPAPAEIGGVFSLTGIGETATGGFAAKR